MVRYLLSLKVSHRLCAQSNKKRETALWIAARNGYTALCDMLLDATEHRRGFVDRDDLLGISPLCVAAGYGHADTCRLLLKRKARWDKRSASTPAFDSPNGPPRLHGLGLRGRPTDPWQMARDRGGEETVMVFEGYLRSHFGILFRTCVVGRRTHRRSGHPFSERHRIASDRYLSRYLVSFLVGDERSLVELGGQNCHGPSLKNGLC